MMNRHIGVREMHVAEFTAMLKENRFLIPSFQREFVWDRGSIIKLWESLYRFYPIGSILCWETDIRLNIHRKIGGYRFKNQSSASGTPGKQVYILDGQQRATALLLPLVGSDNKTKGAEVDGYALYFDATDETFFFADEFNRRKRQVPSAFLLPLGEIIRRGTAILDAAARESAFCEAIKRNMERLLRIFSHYNLSLIHIKGFDIPAVREIFERINQEGKELSSMDIMIARTFRDYEYLVEEDF